MGGGQKRFSGRGVGGGDTQGLGARGGGAGQPRGGGAQGGGGGGAGGGGTGGGPEGFYRVFCFGVGFLIGRPEGFFLGGKHFIFSQ